MNGDVVVIGGGIGGLLAAHALAGRFERVTLLERHGYPRETSSPAPPARRGVPQSRCLHLLMAAGAAAFDELVPGWRTQLVALGAVPFDVAADAATRYPTGWLPRTYSGITAYACSRALLERVLLSELETKTTVQVRENEKVVGLRTTARGERVTGVRVLGADGSGEAIVTADLVVDASGRGSILPDWIRRLPGRSGMPVDETVVESGMQYVSRWFHLQPDDAPDWQCLSIAPASGRDRSAMMLRAEDDRWGVVLLAPPGEPLPSDDQAFLDFTADLGEGRLRATLARATAVSSIHHYGPAPSRLRHYERLTTWPEGLVALGDSVCALDPYFGLGMTMTARGVVLLARRLGQQGGTVTAGGAFQRELAALHMQPWRLATGRDGDGHPLARGELDLGRLRAAAPSSPEIAHALLAVQHLLRPVETLMELCAR